jgi:NAD(P)-dependent dehydrogenase (short-subunit alcohol dehydrogenase family)
VEHLSGKVAVVTGGAGGIGFATAKRLLQEGMRIVLADIDAGALREAERQIGELGGEVLAVPTDVGDLGQMKALGGAVVDRFGRADLVFNNAGVGLHGSMVGLRHEDWEWMIRINLWGVIHGIEVFVPRLIEQGEGGHIVNTASFAGLVPNRGLGLYCVTKYGVVALSECLRHDLRPYGIGVSVLCPMRVRTGILEKSAESRARVAGPLPAEGVLAAPDEEEMVGRTIEAEEVAERVVRAVRENRLYILTHEEARPFIRRRFERIDRAFES